MSEEEMRTECDRRGECLYPATCLANDMCVFSSTPDPRAPDQSRSGIFRDHNCAYCASGEKPCKQGNPSRCEYPHARND